MGSSFSLIQAKSEILTLKSEIKSVLSLSSRIPHSFLLLNYSDQEADS